MKAQRIGVICLILVASLFVFVPLTKDAHAANPVVNTHAVCQTANGPTCITSSMLITTSGDIIILLIGFENVGAQNINPIASITDTQGLNYTAQAPCTQVFDTVNTRYIGSCVYTATTTSTTANTVTITWAQPTNYFAGATEVDVSNLNGPNLVAGTWQTGSCLTNASCSQAPITSASSSFNYSSGQLPVDVLGSDAGGTCGPAGGSNYLPLYALTSYGCSAHAQSNAANPTNFPLAMTVANDWIDTGVVIGAPIQHVTITVTVTRVVACNFYQEQCWWEPMLFYGMYVGLWVGIAVSINVRARSLTFVLGAATSYASLYLILLGELPYPFAIISFAAALVYALRLDGVF